MRRLARWILPATLALLAVGSAWSLLLIGGALPCVGRDVVANAVTGVAHAQESMRFEPVPPETVVASERRRAERMAVEAERRSRESSHPDLPVPPDAPDLPDPPDYSHAGDLVRIGSDIHIERGQVVEGDVFALRGDIRVDGHVKGNVAATGGDVTLGPTARIDGDVMCIGGKLEEEEGARVGGQRVTALRGERGKLKKAFRGDLDEDDVEEAVEDAVHNASKVGVGMSWLLVSLLLAWAITRFAPHRTGVALRSLEEEPGLSLMFGLGIVLMLIPSIVAMALVVAILCITIIGIPLALGVLVAYAGLMVVLALWGYVIGVIPVGEQFGRRIGRGGTMVRAALWGTVVVAGARLMAEILHFVPLFDWFANLLWVVAFLLGAVVTLMGAGALVRTKLGQGRDAPWWPLFTRAKPATAVAAAGEPGAPPPSSPPPPPPPPVAPGPSEPTPAA